MQAEAAAQRLVEMGVLVGGQDGDAAVLLEPLQEEIDGDIGVAIVRVPDLGASGEERVGLVEQQHGVGALGLVEQARQALLRLAHPAREDLRQVDLVQLEAELARDQSGQAASCRCRAAPRRGR